MGVINVTPDSFADGGVRFDPERAIEDGLRMVAEGADILDVGGESTRPGAEALDAAEELRRVLPVVERLASAGAPVSVDTYKAVVAREAVARGAVIVNDISALEFDHELGDGRGRDRRGGGADAQPRALATTCIAHADYDECAARDRGGAAAARWRGQLTPGIVARGGHPRSRARVCQARRPLVCRAGAPRRLRRARPADPVRSLAQVVPEGAIGDRPPAEREWGTAAAVAASVLLGAHIVRVHAVQEMVDVVRVADRIRSASGAATEVF